MITKDISTAKGKREITFFPVTIKEITQSANSPEWTLIKLTQKTLTKYFGSGRSTGFELQNEVAPNPLEYEGERTNTQRVKNEVAEKFSVGQELASRVIQRTSHDSPQWDGHQPAQDGMYYTSQLVAESAYAGDINAVTGEVGSAVRENVEAEEVLGGVLTS